MDLSPQYRREALETLKPPDSRQGIVDAFDSAYGPDEAGGPHYNRFQYPDKGPSLQDRLHTVSTTDKEQIIPMVKAYAGKTAKETVSILDFGAGNGRLNGLYESLGADLSKSSKKLRVIALDSSKTGLNEFAKKLKQAGFQTADESKSIEPRKLETGDPGYLMDEFTKENVTIKLVHSNVDNKPSDVKKLVLDNNEAETEVGLTLSFDTLPFIEGSELRAEFIKTFRAITEADLLVTVPGMNASVDKWHNYREEFDSRRATDKEVGLATEEDSVMYNFKENYLFYQFFDNLKLAKEAVGAGLEDFKIRFNQMRHQQRLDQMPGEEALDNQTVKVRNAQLSQLEAGEAELVRTPDAAKEKELTEQRVHLNDYFRDLDGFIQLHHKPKES